MFNIPVDILNLWLMCILLTDASHTGRGRAKEKKQLLSPACDTRADNGEGDLG